MNSKKSILWLTGYAIIGSGIFTLLPNTPPMVSFLLGIVVTTIILATTFSTATSEETNEANDTELQTLYVGNLPYKAGEQEVMSLFSEYGQVDAVRLMKDKRTGKRRGFGFVVVAQRDAEAIITALNEKEYLQRTLKVRVANEPKHGAAEDV